MSSQLSDEELLLRQQTEESRRVLEELEGELHAAESVLEELGERNQQYDIVTQICQSLEALDDLGASNLFWTDLESRESHLAHAHGQIEAFHQAVAKAENHRESIVARIAEQNDTLDQLHYELRDIIAKNESIKNAWLVERDPDEPPVRPSIMPWSRGYEEDERFRRSLGISVFASILLAVLVGSITLPIKDHSTVDDLPERVAKLVRKEIPPPPPEPVTPPPEEVEEPEPEPEVAEEQPPEKLPESKPEPQVAESPQPDTREKVKSKGILAFRESFADRANMKTPAKLGSQAKLRNAGEEKVGRPERMMVATSASGSSGGINLANISRDVGGGGEAIGGVEVTRVASSIGGAEGVDRPLSAGATAGRTDEEIQIVFDRYKAALYRLYNRELRKDPTLRGQLVLKLTIEPDGSVSLCELESSNMGAPALAQQVVQRVSNFDFGAKEDVGPMTIIYPIDFLPAV